PAFEQLAALLRWVPRVAGLVHLRPSAALPSCSNHFRLCVAVQDPVGSLDKQIGQYSLPGTMRKRLAMELAPLRTTLQESTSPKSPRISWDSLSSAQVPCPRGPTPIFYRLTPRKELAKATVP